MFYPERLVPIRDGCEQGLVDEITAEQVIKIPLDEYQVGQPRYEALMLALQHKMEEAI